VIIMTHTRRLWSRAAFAGMVLVAACGDFDVANENAPTVDQLEGNPTRAILARAATGIFTGVAGLFDDVGADIQQYGIYGRELYNLAGNDPRDTGEEIRGPQDPGGRAGLGWANKYAQIRTINVYLRGVTNSTELSEEEKHASLGFAKTIEAWFFHRLIVRTGPLGIPMDVDRAISDDPAPFVGQTEAYAAVVALLDEARADLLFEVAPGWTGFTTPAEFITFNRGLLAKVQVNRALLAGCGGPCFTSALTALSESFINTGNLPQSLSEGVYSSYDEAAGEPPNPITENLTAQRYYIHPSIAALVQNRPDGSPDLRWTSKVRAGTPKTLNDLTGTLKPILYNANTSTQSAANLSADIPLLKNEELILLRAEAALGLGDKQGALDDINRIRVNSGGLAPSSLTASSSNEDIITELLYNRLMSLIFEQGTRWIDARKYGRLGSLPLDRAGDVVHPYQLVPTGECDARELAVPCDPLATRN
jgi:hypothetical protein